MTHYAHLLEMGSDDMSDDGLEDHVGPQFGCPDCGETRVDYLQILEDAEHDVLCLTCNTGYNHAAEPDVDMRREDHYLAGIIPQKPIY